MAPMRIGFIGFDGVGTMEMTTAAAAFNCAEIQEGTGVRNNVMK